MEKTKPKKFFNIKTKIIFNVFLFIFIILGLVFSLSFIGARKIFKDGLKERLLSMVSIASLSINAEDHKMLKVIADEESDNYKNIVDTLNNIQNNSKDIYYVYTMRENNDGSISFIVDPDDDPSTVSHIGTPYEDPSIFLKNNFITMEGPTVEEDFYTDQWGTWLSGYAPFYDKNGNREGILGMDIRASDILNKEKELIFIYLISFILFLFVSVVVSIFWGNKLSSSLRYMTDSIKDDKNKVKKPIMIDEMAELSSVIKSKLEEANASQNESVIDLENKERVLEKMNRLMVGRELEMIKLKKEIAELKNNNK